MNKVDSTMIVTNERTTRETATINKLLDLHDEALKINNIKLLEINVIKKEITLILEEKASKFDQSDLY
tara:strand:- start:304 stop:507 length:204 start_codon:yes stop_codon:yes gene_type:complete